MGPAEACTEWLRSIEDPLTPITLNDAYGACAGLDQNAVRAAFYDRILNTPVSRRHGRRKIEHQVYYGIRYPIDESQDVYLSFPGITRADIKADDDDRGAAIKQELLGPSGGYGEETLSYWVSHAQARSVVQSPGMARVRKRGRACRLCGVLGDSLQREGSTEQIGNTLRASHLVSRKSLFWRILREVHGRYPLSQTPLGIFSPEATQELRTRLKEDPLHSDSRYIIMLCTFHDRKLQGALREPPRTE